MDCSIKNFVSSECDREGMKQLLQDMSTEDRYLITRRLELATDEHHPLKVTTICPSHATEFLDDYKLYFFSRIFVLEEIQELYSNSVSFFNLRMESKLRQLQAETIHKMLMRKNVFAVLPTSYGKSLAAIASTVIRAQFSPRKIITLIISPLRNLSEQFKVNLTACGLPAVILTPKGNDTGDLIQMAGTTLPSLPLFIISSPETLMLTNMKRLIYKLKIDQVIIDEAHTVIDWGSTFRQAYLSLNDMTDIVDCPVAMFSATVADNGRLQSTLSTCGIDQKKLEMVTASPDRPEIFLHVVKRTSNHKHDLQFLADEFNELGANMKRTIVFVNSVDSTATTNIHFRRLLNNRGKITEPNGDWNYVADHFSSSADDVTKRVILKRFCDPNSNLRVLFSTIGYGLGMDNKSVQRVIVYDAEPSASQMWQKVGRCARDGTSGEAYIFTRGGASSGMYGKTGCARDSILTNLIGHMIHDKTQDCHACSKDPCLCSLCKCCSICKSKCSCYSASHNDPIYEELPFALHETEHQSQ